MLSVKEFLGYKLNGNYVIKPAASVLESFSAKGDYFQISQFL
jgi:hypothetical protein